MATCRTYANANQTTKSTRGSGLFLGFDCAISISSSKVIADKLGELQVEKMTFKSIVGIAQQLNPLIRGWIHYYGRYRILILINTFV